MLYHYAVVLIHLLTAVPLGSGCLPTNLPPYRSYDADSGSLGDRIQAVIPSYRFSCAGRVTGWGGCFFPRLSRYFIIYQVWRETSPACYRLVGSTSTDKDHLLIAEGGCNKTVLPPQEYISVQEGDVVGYYSDYWYRTSETEVLNTDFILAGFQLVRAERFNSTEVFYSQGSSEGDLSTSYAAGTSVVGCGDSVLAHRTTGAPVITAIFEPTKTSSTDPQPGDKSDEMEDVSTIIFSSLSSSTITVAAAHSSISHTTTTTAAPSRSVTPPPHTASVLTTTPSAGIFGREVQATVELLHSGQNSTNIFNSKQRLILLASLMGLFNVGLVLAAILLLVVCVHYRARQSRRRRPHTISPPTGVVHTTSGNEASGDGAAGQSESHSPDWSEDRISMIPNCLYGMSVSPVGGPSHVMEGLAGSDVRRVASIEALRRDSPRAAVDSMIYNKIYGSYSSSKAQSNTPLTRHSGRNLDSGAYEYIDDYNNI